ncbi:hypothetical protein ACFVVA_36835, partial [Kitasatospora sp. NPDC058048]
AEANGGRAAALQLAEQAQQTAAGIAAEAAAELAQVEQGRAAAVEEGKAHQAAAEQAHAELVAARRPVEAAVVSALNTRLAQMQHTASKPVPVEELVDAQAPPARKRTRTTAPAKPPTAAAKKTTAKKTATKRTSTPRSGRAAE